ncbi:hypothetical protein QH494_25440 [Sphingomonas sp. AR_OL41]|uniref:hypothetical protein n=1 Tax=Sphingomonas sp. AR_OL41 TaxID=3042729 RepID=UPI00248152B1|nr:hypothetical protein [Sphingomonas sp. AR_OL41]MDH7975544.1 hypothetical protein [Sphingomonas sp. AR_OL41]
MLTFGSIINGAFRHFRERPLAVLGWSAVYTVIMFAYTLVMMPTMARQMAGMQNGAAPPALGMLGMLLPFYLIILVVTLVLIAASLRTILRPGEDSLLGLRLGMDELRLLGLFVILGIGFFIVAVVGALIVAAIGGVFAMALGGSRGGLGLAVVPLLILAFYGALVFLMVRLSLVSALTISRRKIIIGESWRLTKGHFWRLFGAYFVLGVMLFILYMVVLTFTIGPVLAQAFSHGFSQQAIQAFSQLQMQSQLGGLSLLTILSAIGNGLLVGLSYAIWGGAAATATQDLIGTTDVDLVETFA